MFRGFGVLLASFVLTGIPAGADSWRLADRLFGSRVNHTATLLPSGQVLVAGGSGDRGVLASAELYDPSTGKWTRVDSLRDARSFHTATLLPSGQVLVAGGYDGSAALASAELYDPSEGTWIQVNDLRVARYLNTATLLPSGQVLVAGGSGDSGHLASAELYDPSTGCWTPVPHTLQDARSIHTATLLPSGQVLVTGGIGGIGYLASTELYDPSEGTWTRVGDLQVAREGHTATLLPSGQVLVAGGQDASGVLASAELYDPGTSSWTLVQADPVLDARSFHTATLLPSGQVLVAGGGGASGTLASAQLYDPSGGGWTEAAPLNEVREGHTATLLPSGQVLVAGGQSVSGSSALVTSTELYDPSTGRWSRVDDSLQDTPETHTATLLPSGQVLVAGGLSKSGNHPVLKSAELYDPSEGAWIRVMDLQVPRRSHTATLLPSGQVLVAGGIGKLGSLDTLDSAELYDPSTNSWTTADSLTYARHSHTATLLPSGQVLVAGGVGLFDQRLASAELYDPYENSWTPVGPLEDARSLHTATLLPSGQVLVAGGANVVTLASAELYDPSTRTWTPVDPLRDARHSHTATLLPSGRVLVAGGAVGFNSSPGILAFAELFDPSTGSWIPVLDPLEDARHSHTATLLPSGQVLVAGGLGDLGQVFQSAELYDPSTGSWTPAAPLKLVREKHTATLLPSGQVLVAGGDFSGSAELYDPGGFDANRRSVVTALPSTIDYISPFEITGTGLGGDSEASGGRTASSAVNQPRVQLRALEKGAQGWLSLAPPPVFCPHNPDAAHPLGFCDDQEATLTVSGLPPIFDPGPHLLTVYVAGVPSEARLVDLECGVSVTDPDDQTVAIGERATFGPVETRGGRHFQWQQCQGDPATACAGTGTGWIDIPGATSPSYSTPQITGPESGTRYRVVADSDCTEETSAAAVLAVSETTPPAAAVVTPDGGELWTLSTATEPSTETISWTMSDNVRICQVGLELVFSRDGGQTFASSGLPPLPSFSLGDNCAHPGLGTTSTTFTLPEALPAGEEGVLYKVRLTVTDHAGNSTVDESDKPFFIVRPNNDSIKTLILWHRDRMRDLLMETAGLADALGSFAAHPRVQGRIVDLGGFPDLETLYDRWDAGQADANDVLFAPGGLHEKLGERLAVFTGVRYLVLVGDDRVIPLARIDDRTATAPEEVYPDPANGDLTADGTTVGEALAANRYLSDDPLASVAGLTRTRLEDGPDLAVGRLVETPAEIIASIATFISQEGILDLTGESNKVLVSAYDFLVDSGTKIRRRWSAHLSAGVEPGTLIGQDWTGAELEGLLCEQYGVLSLNGHATHHEEGHPSAGGPFDIQGLDTDAIVAAGCGLPGSVVYAVGCHSGLPVAGSVAEDDHPLDLPQTMLGAGAMVYLANTGYGWGLKHGVGYSERLVEIFTEELTAGDSVILGDAVKRAKLLYSLNASRFDVYDEKVSKQWTLYGFPMYALKTRNPESAKAGDSRRLFEGPPLRLGDLAWRESFGPVTVGRRILGKTFDKALVAPPPFLTRLNLGFDFSGEGVYKKLDAAGNELALEAPCDTPEGCYYTLNNVTSGQDLATGATDRPLQPVFVFDSRLSGTAYHGFLWKGGTYVEERGWIPLVAELQSNVPGESFDAGSLPDTAKSNGRGRLRTDTAGSLAGICPASDLDVSSLVLEAGEVLRESDDSPAPDVQRRYETVDVEIFYFNNTGNSGANCDVSGPTVARVEHRSVGATVDWEVEASDPAGVWRVVVVWNDGTVDPSGRGRWSPLELAADAAGVFRGSVQALGTRRLTYFVQAVDRKGNVTVPVGSVAEPPSGVPLDLPELVTVDLAQGDADLAVAVTAAQNPVQGLETLSATIDVTNRGPDPAAAIAVTVALPAGLADVFAVGSGWSCEVGATAALCRRSVAELGPAPPITLLATAPPIGGDVVLTATVATSSHDAVAANDSASVTVTVLPAPQVDLAVEQTVSFADDGRSPVFTVTVRNPGSTTALGARVFDAFPAALTRVAWTCVARPASICSPSGVGPIDDLVTVGWQSRVDYVVSTTLASGFGGLLTNTATVAPPAGFYDPRPETNSATVTIDYGSIFTDGFESGDVARWSAAVGVVP